MKPNFCMMKPNFYGVARISRDRACFDSVKVLDGGSTEPFSLPFLSARHLDDGLHLVAGTIRLVQGRPYACIAGASRAQLPPMLRLAGSMKDGNICGTELSSDIADGDFEGVVLAVAGSSLVFGDLATASEVSAYGARVAGTTGDPSPEPPPTPVLQPPRAAATPEPTPVSQPAPPQTAPDANTSVAAAEPVPLITCSMRTELPFPVESEPVSFLMPTDAPVRTSAVRVTSAAAVRSQKPAPADHPAPKPAAAHVDVAERGRVVPEGRLPPRELPRGPQKTPRPLSEARSQAPQRTVPERTPPPQETPETKDVISPGDKENIVF
jgi:hypothetical protein